MAKFELRIEADSCEEFKDAVIEIAHEIIEGEARAALEGAAPTRCQPGRAVDIWKEEPGPGVKKAPPLGSERRDKE